MKYSYPHDEISIIDRSQIPVLDTVNNGAKLLTVFVSDKGEDSKMMTLNNYDKAVKNFGYPNMKRTGQSYFQVVNWLENGGVVNAMRLTAEDATYSNSVIVLKIKKKTKVKADSQGKSLYRDKDGKETTESNNNTPILESIVTGKIEVESFTDLKLNTKQDVLTMINKKYPIGDEEIDKISETSIPLFVLTSKGKGKYGNAYRYRLTPNPKADNNNLYRNYNFDLFENNQGLKRIEDGINVSTFIDAVDYYRRSEYIEDVIKRNIIPINLYALENRIDMVNQILLPVIQQEYVDYEEYEVDSLFGLNKEGKPYKHYKLDSSGINLSLLEGVNLDSGSDGAFDVSNKDRNIAIIERYKKAYNGEIDPKIMNHKKFPADVILDANLPLEVKKVMQACRDKRDDGVLLLDGCVMQTILACKLWRKNDMYVDNYGTRVYCQHFDTYDRYNSKQITVTIPYLFSILLPSHFKNPGYHKPLAGVNYPVQHIVIPDTLKPEITDPDDKEDFKDLRLNYLEEECDKIIIGTQWTSQSPHTQLSYGNNVHILYDMKRKIENAAPTLRFEFSEGDADLEAFTKLFNTVLDDFNDYKCRKATALVEQTSVERENHQLRTTITVIFKSTNEKNDITFYIERSI